MRPVTEARRKYLAMQGRIRKLKILLENKASLNTIALFIEDEINSEVTTQFDEAKANGWI